MKENQEHPRLRVYNKAVNNNKSKGSTVEDLRKWLITYRRKLAFLYAYFSSKGTFVYTCLMAPATAFLFSVRKSQKNKAVWQIAAKLR
jgi:hypothetical protein